MKKMAFLAACRDFFGPLPGQTAMQFGKEVMALSPKDREEIKAGLEQNGYEITNVTTVKEAEPA